ncbi:hypothetical protein [Serratia ficaria]|nr:hypothetical protein [Serratia ficaria]
MTQIDIITLSRNLVKIAEECKPVCIPAMSGTEFSFFLRALRQLRNGV